MAFFEYRASGNASHANAISGAHQHDSSAVGSEQETFQRKLSELERWASILEHLSDKDAESITQYLGGEITQLEYSSVCIIGGPAVVAVERLMQLRNGPLSRPGTFKPSMENA